MSNKVKFSIMSGILCLAFLGFVLRQKTNEIDREGKINETNSKQAKRKVKKISQEKLNQVLLQKEEKPAKIFPKRIQEKTEKNIHKKTRKNIRTQRRNRTIVYSDPVNDRVLGDPRWAATTSKAEQERIEKAFETPPEDPSIISLSRQRSIDAVKLIVNGCYQELLQVEPKAKGRLAVTWVAGKNGKISKLKLGANVDLRFPSFTDCILNRTQNLTFETNAEDIFVEYPFAFL